MKLVIANWKANPTSFRSAVSLARKIDSGIEASGKVEVVIASPFPFLSGIGKAIRRAKLGAQDLFWKKSGPYTGEVSPLMLKDLGVRYVIVGHSERRRWLGETDEMVNRKVITALKTGLKVVLCVGEPLEIRKKGLTAAKNFVRNQLEKDLLGTPDAGSRTAGVVIAYEPIWAIGTGRSDRPEDALEMARFIKNAELGKRRKFSVLYGGSVNSQNAKSFLQYKEIDGALVGGASLKPGEFRKIVRIADKNTK